MKKFLVIIAAGISLASCTKNVSGSSENKKSTIFFQDAGIAVKDMSAINSGSNNVTVHFSTAFEKNISRIELMSSESATTFCAIQGTDISGNSAVEKNYNFSDSNAKSGIMYYMLRFKDISGNWIYSSYLTVSVD